MDVFQHTAQGYAVGRTFFPRARWWVHSVCAFLGALPDLIGQIGVWIDGTYRIYNVVHAIELWNVLVIPYSLHLVLDSFTHTAPWRWWIWGEGLWIEVVGWVITLAWLYLVTRKKEEL